MIDDEKTFREKGYRSTDLSHGSGKDVWRVCDGCGEGKWTVFNSCSDLCQSCSNRTEDHRMKLSKALSGENHPMYGMHHSEETLDKMRKAQKGKIVGMLGKHHSGKTKKLLSKLKQGENNNRFGIRHSEETLIKMRDAQVGENNPNWNGGSSFEPYCEKFNDAFKEAVRDRFGRLCFMCLMTEENNGRKLCVHHVSYDKDCICNRVECEFVPLCSKCHGRTNNNHDIWERLIMNVLWYEGWI